MEASKQNPCSLNMLPRCQISKADSHDPTGEHAMECNAPAEYCPICDMSICPECHLEITGSRTTQKKNPCRSRYYPQFGKICPAREIDRAAISLVRQLCFYSVSLPKNLRCGLEECRQLRW